MNNEFEDLAKEFGYDIPEELTRKNKGKYYSHNQGTYQAVIGRLKLYYLDDDGNRVEKDSPNAVKLGYGMLEFIIVKNSDGEVLIGKDKNIEGIYGRYIYNQYISFDEDRQWSNARLLKDLHYNNYNASVVSEDEDGTEVIKYGNLIWYYGAPVQFTLKESKKGNMFIDGEVILLDHSIDKEKLKKRQEVFSAVESQLAELLEKQKSEKQKSDEGAVVEGVEDDDSFLDDVF